MWSDTIHKTKKKIFLKINEKINYNTYKQSKKTNKSKLKKILRQKQSIITRTRNTKVNIQTYTKKNKEYHMHTNKIDCHINKL